MLSTEEHEEASLEEVEVIDETSMVGEGDYCGWFGLPPTEEEMLSADPAVINSILAEKARMARPNEGMDGTF